MKNEDKLKLARKKDEDKKRTRRQKAKASAKHRQRAAEEIAQIKQAIEGLADALRVKVDLKGLDTLDKHLKQLSELPKGFERLSNKSDEVKQAIESIKIDEVSIKGFRSLWETIVRANNDQLSKIDEKTAEKFADLETYLEQLTEEIKQGQEPEDYRPVRLVVGGDGSKLDFLKQMPSPARGGSGPKQVGINDADDNQINPRKEDGHGSSSSDPTFSQIVDSGGEAATVTNGKLDVNAGGTRLVSTNNSTTSALNANDTFTGSFDDVDAYDFLEIVIYTDQDSATDGAKLLLSADGGTTTHKTLDATITGGVGAFSYIIPITAYNAAKITYTNGNTDQGDFDLRTVYQAGAAAQAAAPLGSEINATNSAQLTRAILATESVDGSYGNLKDRSNNLQTSIENHQVDTPIKALSNLQVTRVTVGTSAVRIDPSALTDRKTVAVKAITDTNEIVYVGHSNAVTTGNGWPLGNADSIEFEIDDTQQVWAIASAADQSVALSEVS